MFRIAEKLVMMVVLLPALAIATVQFCLIAILGTVITVVTAVVEKFSGGE